MRRIVIFIIISLILCSCTSFVESTKQTAQFQMKYFLATRFSKQLGTGIDIVINQLAKKGGFLDDPLVRIMLPPPIGLAIGIARDLQKDPKAALLEILINQAAENTIPVAGPILKKIITDMNTFSIEELLDSGDKAATEYLKEKGGAAINEVLLPAVTKELHLNGAIELYGKLLKARETAQEITSEVEEVKNKIETSKQTASAIKDVTQEELGQYVAEQAMSGLFKKVADEELSIRRSMESYLNHKVDAD
jgi:hypothetical protein